MVDKMPAIDLLMKDNWRTRFFWIIIDLLLDAASRRAYACHE
jgi:hypothetical protein